ncbi:hypothetical protein RB195_013461 [Necator americanus]|uniref:RUN domain-containing protein n=1 Tax=Necator americanus TaxID=51031 RepID=A0ABR1DVN6_NECAM
MGRRATSPTLTPLAMLMTGEHLFKLLLAALVRHMLSSGAFLVEIAEQLPSATSELEVFPSIVLDALCGGISVANLSPGPYSNMNRHTLAELCSAFFVFQTYRVEFSQGETLQFLLSNNKDEENWAVVGIECDISKSSAFTDI